MYANFGSVRYDPLDPECEKFKADFENFQSKCSDLDRKLAATLEQALDDIFNLDSLFKVNKYNRLCSSTILFNYL